jgi:CIC family chloride channel protein
MAAVFAAAGRVPLANLIMVTEMTRGYGLIVPTMVAVSLAYLTQALLTRRARYLSLYEAQVDSAAESQAHHEEYYRATAGLLRKRQVRLEEDILRREFVEALARGLPIPLGHGDEELFTVNIAPGSPLAGMLLRNLKLDVVVVGVIRGETERIPRGDTLLRAGDTVIVAGHPEGVAAFRELSQTAES